MPRNVSESEAEQVKTQLPELPENYQSSLISILTTAKVANYSAPWQGFEQQKWSGSGFAVTYKNRKFILTNAHVADSSVSMELRLANQSKYYPAKMKTIDFDSDLAFIEVEKKYQKDFWSNVNCLELGDMFTIGQPVNVCGFPMGISSGELCVTEGQISRISFGGNATSLNANLLQGQVSAAINPGNSGGPVLSGKKVIGVAFQGYEGAQSLGYIISVPVIKHFLDDILSNGPYKGFPALDFKYQLLNNQEMKKFHGMKKDETGIRISELDSLSSAGKILQAGDIITSIDGVQVQNDASVRTSFFDRVNFEFLITQKQLGESISMQIIRDKQRLDVKVPLLNKARMTKLITQEEHGIQPTYYIASGIVFTPVTINSIIEQIINMSDEDESKSLSIDSCKRQLGQQAIIIHSILPSEFTRGYSGFNHSFVVVVNDKKIFNMLDLVDAFEKNHEKQHTIITDTGNAIIVKKLSSQEHKPILENFGITNIRSENLKHRETFRNHTIGTPEYWMTADQIPSPDEPSSPVAVIPEGGRAKVMGFAELAKEKKELDRANGLDLDAKGFFAQILTNAFMSMNDDSVSNDSDMRSDDDNDNSDERNPPRKKRRAASR